MQENGGGQPNYGAQQSNVDRNPLAERFLNDQHNLSLYPRLLNKVVRTRLTSANITRGAMIGLILPRTKKPNNLVKFSENQSGYLWCSPPIM
jgi:hypothetical protein